VKPWRKLDFGCHSEIMHTAQCHV